MSVRDIARELQPCSNTIRTNIVLSHVTCDMNKPRNITKNNENDFAEDQNKFIVVVIICLAIITLQFIFI